MKKISILLITLGCLLGLNMSLSAQSTGTENGHEWVDLGLPSGLKWATCNVGASSPEKSGNYYAWGETKPKDEYNNGLTYDKQMDDISGNAQYDAATANWGGDWRMPTKEEMEELVNNCICEMIRQNGARGYKLTGPNGNSIFLPEGARYNRELVMCKSVFYWTSTPTSSLKSSVYLSISDTGERIVGTIDNLVYNRSSGLHIRPVKSRVGIETPIVTASVVEFTDITAIIKTYATDGGAELIERGFYWGTNPNPSETDNKVVIENTVGNKINALLNLTPNTTYYVKAYATNSEGTSYSEVVSFTTLEEIVHEYVDLGLPSGLKWATCNVGANSPEEYGNYYACGEVVTKTEYSSSNCPTYGLTTSQLQAQGYIDGEGNLTAQYDAATANWGGNWRMPTKAEMQELIGNCTWEWTTQNGKNGCKVTGPNGNYIFLPAAGRRDGSSLFNVGSIGSFWSSSPFDKYNAKRLTLNSSSPTTNYYYERNYGYSVRPVLE